MYNLYSIYINIYTSGGFSPAMYISVQKVQLSHGMPHNFTAAVNDSHSLQTSDVKAWRTPI